MKIFNSTESLEILAEHCRNNKRCIFSRFGDLDILFASGTHYQGQPLPKQPMGGNKSVWSPAIRLELVEALQLSHPDYFLALSGDYETEEGMIPGVFKSFETKQVLINKIKALTDQQEFLLPVLFQYLCAFKPDIFKGFVDEFIRGKKILYIGGTPKPDAEVFLGEISHYVPTAQTDAYRTIKGWWQQVESILDHREVDVVIPSCGQSSRVISKRIFEGGWKVHSFDMGSLFDAISRPTTRTWLKHKSMDIVENFYQPA